MLVDQCLHVHISQNIQNVSLALNYIKSLFPIKYWGQLRQILFSLAMGPSLEANISRGSQARSHGVCYVVQTEMSSHWLTLGAMQLMHRYTCFGRHIGLVRTVTMNIALWFLCVLYFLHHGCGEGPLSTPEPMDSHGYGCVCYCPHWVTLQNGS